MNKISFKLKLFASFIFSAYICYCVLILYNNDNSITYQLNKMFNKEISDNKKNISLSIPKSKKSYLIDTPTCKIPNLPVKSKIYLKYFNNKLLIPQCDKFKISNKKIQKQPVLVISNLTHLWIDKSSVSSYVKDIKNLKCCFRVFKRKQEDTKNYTKDADSITIYSNVCIPFNAQKPTLMTELGVEFIRTECSKTVKKNKNIEVNRDFHAFLPTSKQLEKRLSISDKENSNKWNILILGIDSMSRLNMLRQLPLTHKYLTKQLSSDILLGYNKVGDNTFPNVIPLLSGLTVQDFNNLYKPNSLKLDDAPLIWKNFSNNGFVTAFGEDFSRISTFNYLKKGFVQQPTDYYLRPFLMEIEKQIGHQKTKDGFPLCSGSRQSISFILNYIKKFTLKFIRKRYFSFFWINGISHNDMNMPHIVDKLLVDMFTYLAAKNAFERTIIFLISDHGMRFGSFRNTEQGFYENRLPVAYIHLPKTFKNKFPNNSEILKYNAENRLITAYDLHATLVDLINPENMNNNSYNYKFGASLFSNITNNRTCENVGIPAQFCTCQPFTILDPKKSKIVQRIVNYALTSLNKELKKLFQNKCAILTLNEINHAKETYKNLEQRYFITFTVAPSEAIFEATVIVKDEDKSKKDNFIMDAPLDRLNSYKDQGNCINNANYQKYCYCSKKTFHENEK